MIRKYIPLLLAVCLIALGWVLYVYVFPNPRSVYTAHTPSSKATITVSGDSAHYTSGPRDRARAVLSDGTEMVLNPNTEIIVPKTFTDTVREIRVNGDAYFVVANKDFPFMLTTRNLRLLIGGESTASFRVTAFDKDEGESVEVLKGAVNATKNYVSKDNEAELLAAGDMVMINRSIDLMEKETFDVSTLQVWCDDRLVFNNASFDTVVRQLQDWFGITINVNGTPDDLAPLSVSFRHANLEEVLGTLSKAYHCKFRIEKYAAELDF